MKKTTKLPRPKTAQEIKIDKLKSLIEACLDRYDEEDMIAAFNAVTRKQYKELDAEEIAKDGDLMEDVLYEYRFERNVAEDYLCQTLENNGWKCFKAQSLAEEIKIEAFMNDLQENPYQLKLIA
jgi:hypothetical protein